MIWINLLLALLMNPSCETKVSEWVLLNNEPDDYTLAYFHGNTAGDDAGNHNAAIASRISGANIRFRDIPDKEVVKPYYALYLRDRIYERYNDIGELDRLIRSPLRDKIAADLMSGKLCVMLYLKTGIPAKDNTGLQILKKSIGESPFADIIPVAELSRDNREERNFVSMLLGVEDDLSDISEPMLFGIFGRFRALEPLVAKGITLENIHLMIDFLTADCSCLIKDKLPGKDILYINKWENPEPALVNKILEAHPELIHH